MRFLLLLTIFEFRVDKVSIYQDIFKILKVFGLLSEEIDWSPLQSSVVPLD